MIALRRFVVLAALATITSCTNDNPPACVGSASATCSPLYTPPTFDNVYNMTIQNSCGSQRVSCHAAGGASGLSMADEATAYANLIGRDYVEPGNAACSDMIVRITSVGAAYQMPQGPASSALSPAEQCSLIQWVAAGAPGPGSAL
jgi:hypothetical protein